MCVGGPQEAQGIVGVYSGMLSLSLNLFPLRHVYLCVCDMIYHIHNTRIHSKDAQL